MDGLSPEPAGAVSDVARPRADLAWRLGFWGLAAAHLAVVSATGLRWEHIAADALLAGLPWLGPAAFELARGLLPLWLAGVLVDWQRFLPLLGPVHTSDVWRLDALLFPAKLHGQRVPWAAWFDAHPKTALDLACGFAYAAYLYEYLLLAVYLFFRRRDRLAPCAWAFFLANAAGAVVYMFLPVAPPWYILQHGLGPADLSALPSAAGCARFDALLHTQYFASFYARNPNIFGAMPSLHVAYPFLAVWFTWDGGWRWRVPLTFFLALVAFSAVYLAHHYVLDVLAGIAIAAASAVVAQRMGRRGARVLQTGGNAL